MKAQLKIKESFQHGLRRVCHRHAWKALASLDEPNQPEAIHSVRKEVKKIRAVLRLVRAGLKHDRYRKISKAIRLAAKPLAAQRDALVTKKALSSLPGTKIFAGIRSVLEKYSKQEERRFRENRTGAVTSYILRQVLKSTANLKTKPIEWRDICPCLCKSYARGRQAYQNAIHRPTPVHFHEWRKQVKNLRDQLNFICPAWTRRTKDMVDDLKLLGDQLGDDHDLVLLKQFAQEQCARCKETITLVRLVDSKRREFQTDIFRLGSFLYELSPKYLYAQLKEDWKVWRHRR